MEFFFFFIVDVVLEGEVYNREDSSFRCWFESVIFQTLSRTSSVNRFASRSMITYTPCRGRVRISWTISETRWLRCNDPFQAARSPVTRKKLIISVNPTWLMLYYGFRGLPSVHLHSVPWFTARFKVYYGVIWNTAWAWADFTRNKIDKK